MRYLLSIAIAIAACAKAPAGEAKIIELTLEPRPIETPALKYRLIPGEAEIKAGDAAPILLRLPWEQTRWMNEAFPKLADWETKPLDAKEWQESNGVIPENFYNEMKRAAFRREASWEYPIWETQSPYMILLPDVQGLRGFLGLGLSARIRYHLSRGELDQAREGILVGLANARHLSQTPFFITQLVATAVQRNMLERVDELVDQPKSPNLYWALTTLPKSLCNYERAASLESDVFTMTFPAARDFDRPRDAQEWTAMADQLVRFLEEMGDIPRQAERRPGASVVEQFFARLLGPEKDHLRKVIDRARADLPQMLNVSPEKVAAMSDDEVGVRWYVRLRVSLNEHVSVLVSLPPREAWPELRRVQAESLAMREKTGAQGHDFLQPANLYLSSRATERKIAALRIVEALRNHLAANKGAWPAKLDDIQDIPIPLDPLTDSPFEWSVSGEVATLKTPPLPADIELATAEESFGFEYRLRLRK